MLFCFVLYLLFGAFPIIMTSHLCANFINYYCLEKQGLDGMYEPEIVRKVFFSIYFVLLIYVTYRELNGDIPDLCKYIIVPAFITYIAYDKAFHREYQMDLEWLRVIDYIMIKHF